MKGKHLFSLSYYELLWGFTLLCILLPPSPISPFFCPTLPKCKQIHIFKHTHVSRNARIPSKVVTNMPDASSPRTLLLKRGKGNRGKHALYTPQNDRACPAFLPLCMTGRRHRCQAVEVFFQ